MELGLVGSLSLHGSRMAPQGLEGLLVLVAHQVLLLKAVVAPGSVWVEHESWT